MSIEVTVRGQTIPPDELAWRFSRSPGPGGQSVNTTDSRVELSYDLAGLRRAPAGAEGAGPAGAGGPDDRRRGHRDRVGAPVPAAQPGGRGGPDVRAADRGDRAAAPAAAAHPAQPGRPRSAGWPTSSAGREIKRLRRPEPVN